MKEKQKKSLTRRFVENNKKFKKEMRITYIGGIIGIFIVVFISSYFILDNFDKTFIINTMMVSLIFAILSGLSTFTIKPKAIFVLVVFISILFSSIIKVI